MAEKKYFRISKQIAFSLKIWSKLIYEHRNADCILVVCKGKGKQLISTNIKLLCKLLHFAILIKITLQLKYLSTSFLLPFCLFIGSEHKIYLVCVHWFVFFFLLKLLNFSFLCLEIATFCFLSKIKETLRTVLCFANVCTYKWGKC